MNAPTMVSPSAKSKKLLWQQEVWRDLQPLFDAQGVCGHCGGLGTISPDVPVTHGAFGMSFLCICRREQVEEKRRWRGQGIPKNLLHCSFETFDRLPDIIRGRKLIAREYAGKMAAFQPMLYKGETKNSLTLQGSFGVGKSGFAACIAQAWMARAANVLWIDANEFLEMIYKVYESRDRDQHPEYTVGEIVEAAQTADLLILDDFGDREFDGEVTKHTRDKFYAVMRHRHADMLPTVITMNPAPAQIKHQFGGRIVERILEMSHVISIGGPSFRTGEVDTD